MMDEDRCPAGLVLPGDRSNPLRMTLPDMGRRTLPLRCRDQSMGVVYSVGDWDIEKSAVPGPMILTLRTPDGFAVSFGLPALELMHRSARAASAGIEASSVIAN